MTMVAPSATGPDRHAEDPDAMLAFVHGARPGAWCWTLVRSTHWVRRPLR